MRSPHTVTILTPEVVCCVPLDIQFQSGSKTVYGRFFPAGNRPSLATVLLLFGFPGNQQEPLGLGTRLSQKGFNILSFNYRGTYRSEGVFSFRNAIEDIDSARAWLARPEMVQNYGVVPEEVILGGHSFGGGIAFIYAARTRGIRRLFLIAGTDHGELVREYQRDASYAETVDRMFQGLKAPDSPVRFDLSLGEPMEFLVNNPAPWDLRLLHREVTERDVLLIGGWDDWNTKIEAHLLPLYRALKSAGSTSATIAAVKDGHNFDKTRDELAALIAGWIMAPGQPA